MVFYDALMGNMRVSHEEAAVANFGVALGLGGPIHCDVFPKDILVADFKIGTLSRVLEILGLTAQHGTFGNQVIASKNGVLFDYGMRTNGASVPDHRTRFEHGIRPYLNPGSNLSPRVDYRCGMNQDLPHRAECSMYLNRLWSSALLIWQDDQSRLQKLPGGRTGQVYMAVAGYGNAPEAAGESQAGPGHRRLPVQVESLHKSARWPLCGP